jgi:hypothetical protein
MCRWRGRQARVIDGVIFKVVGLGELRAQPGVALLASDMINLPRCCLGCYGGVGMVSYKNGGLEWEMALTLTLTLSTRIIEAILHGAGL